MLFAAQILRFVTLATLACSLVIAGCRERPDSTGGAVVDPGTATSARDASIDDALSEKLAMAPGDIERLCREGQFTHADLLRMPRKVREKALYKLDHPKPDHPGEAALFRYQQRLGEDGTIPDNALMIAKQQRDAMIAAQEQAAGGPTPHDAGLEPGAGAWRWLGPGNTGGRVRSLVVDPTQTNTMYAGSVSGGIWKTLNGGQNWFPLDDFMANLAVTSLVMDPSNSSVIYAGTGEGVFGIINSIDGTNNAAAVRGAGIFQTTDGGATWTQIPSTANSNFWYVNRLAIHPTNNQVILAATNTGIWRSTDAGQNWSQTYSGSPVYDVEFDPNNGNIAVAGQVGQSRYSANSGGSWAAAGGIPANAGRVELAVSPNNGRVYASVDINNGEIWRSAAGGASYTQIYSGPPNYLGGQGWYDNTIWVRPQPGVMLDNLIVGGIDLWRANPSPVAYALTKISDWTRVPNPGDSAHADHHIIVADPGFDGTTNRTAYFGNDGGVYGVNNVDTVTTNSGWTNLNNQFGVTQFYGAAAHPTSGTVIGGSQDVGTVTFGGDTDTWSEMFGGDGGFCASDPTNSNVYFSEYITARITRSTDGGASAAYIHNPRGVVSGNGDLSCGGCFQGTNALVDALNGNANFIAPFALDPNNTSTMIVGCGDLWRSTDVQAAQPNWFSIRPSLWTFHSAIAIAPGNSNVIWVGHTNVSGNPPVNEGDLYMTTNGTAAMPTWTQVDNNPPGLPNRWVSSIAIDPTNNNRVYVTFMGYSSNNVWRTTDGGNTWTQITGSGSTALPAAPVSAIALHPSNPGWLYVGTDVGVFASIDDGANWSTTNDGPANVPVDDLFWKNNNTLVAATHGRGIYEFTPPQLSYAGLSAGGAQFGFGSFAPSISAYGRYVSFFDGSGQIYVRDRQNSTTTMVSVDSGGTPGNGFSSSSVISANGQVVAFFSNATNLIGAGNDNNNAADIFVRDLLAGTTTRVSVASDGTEANMGVDAAPAISPDGRLVAFCSSSSTLIGAGNDNNGTQDVFVHARQTGTTTRVSVASDGSEGNGGSCGGWFSGDGRYVAFDSNATNLVANDNSGDFDCFVHDRQTGTTVRASLTTSGGEVSAFNVRPKLSHDGRYVLFETNGDFLSGGDTGGFTDVYSHDRDADTDGIFDEAGATSTNRITVAADGSQGDGNSGTFGWFSISSDNRFVTFASEATNFVADDTNSRSDVFLIDRDTDQDGVLDESGAISTTRVSVDANGLQGNFGNFPVSFGDSNQPVISCNGGVIAFRSTSWSLLQPDNNVEKADVFAFDRLFGTGDVNLDGAVNGLDQQAFLAVLFGTNTNVGSIAEADLNRDGTVDLTDSSILINRLLGKCP